MGWFKETPDYDPPHPHPPVRARWTHHAMTPAAQRIAIAQACGWNWEPAFNARKKSNWLFSPDKKSRIVLWRGGVLGGHGLPDYLADLNAMREALALVRGKHGFHRYLCAAAGGSVTTTREENFELCIHATAAQQAEALLRYCNLWDDSK